MGFIDLVPKHAGFHTYLSPEHFGACAFLPPNLNNAVDKAEFADFITTQYTYLKAKGRFHADFGLNAVLFHLFEKYEVVFVCEKSEITTKHYKLLLQVEFANKETTLYFAQSQMRGLSRINTSKSKC